MARPKKNLQRKDYAVIAAMSARGFRKEDVARRLGIAVRTLDRILAEDERAEEAFAAGRSELHEELVGKLVAKAREGDKACLIFALKAIFQYRENSPIEVEHRHAIQIQLPAAMTPEAYLELEVRKPALPATVDAEVVE